MRGGEPNVLYIYDAKSDDNLKFYRNVKIV